jgi:hypothetical protein
MSTEDANEDATRDATRDGTRDAGRDTRGDAREEELEALRSRLEVQAKLKPWGDLAESLLSAVDALRKAQLEAAHWETVYGHNDSTASLSEVIRARKHLNIAAGELTAACREIARS